MNPIEQLISAAKSVAENNNEETKTALKAAIDRVEHIGDPYQSIKDLVEWESYMGRFDARVWQDARQLVRRLRGRKSNVGRAK